MPGTRKLPRLLIGALVLGSLLFVLTGSRLQTAEALANCDVADLTFDSEEAAFLSLINNYRAQNGLSPLTVSVNLNRAASWMVLDLGNKNYFAHRDSLGREPSERVTQCGGQSYSGENLAAGTNMSSAQDAFNIWRNSPGHNRNMLFAQYTQIGIARAQVSGSTYNWYWATSFGTIDDGTRLSGGQSASTVTASYNSSSPTLSPAPGSALTGQYTTFTWSPVSGAVEYELNLGSTPGGWDIALKPVGFNLTVSVTNLPRDGRTIYARVWARTATGWQYQDYTYTAGP